MRDLTCLIREYEPADRASALDLVNRVFAAAFEIYEPKSAAWWAWKFEQCPSGHRSLVAEDADGKLVGFYGGLLLQVTAHGRPVHFAQSVDTVVDPAFRRGLKNPGLFVRLGQAYESTFAGPDRVAVMYGLPIAGAYRIGARFIDYWMLRAQPAFVLRDDRRLPAVDAAFETVETARFGADSDALVARTFAAATCVARRDAEWLNWRFPAIANDPYHRLEVRHRRSGELLASVVWRSVFFLGREVLALVDAIAPAGESAALAAALRQLLVLAKTQQRDLVTLAAPNSPLTAELVQFGFRTEPTLYVMVGRPFHPDLEPGYLREHWHYTLADLDVI
ncbi:MAG: GNAT family N-acetyltransferase [Planctomycetes bacterium]|nr:GNAT family N-acetyltransferase [Planctomycetota bacterium]MCC7398627.1 GNAT family N-acetyltransferase [Planctomycetota bacterium]